MRVEDLPALNAVLNGTAAALLVTAYILIRKGRREAHKRVMIAAFTVSSLFLISYLTYHYLSGIHRFEGHGAVRTVYFSILISHTILAAAIVPLVLMTLSRALKGTFVRHAALAKFTLPLWLYVSITGVVVYWMLYRM